MARPFVQHLLLVT